MAGPALVPPAPLHARRDELQLCASFSRPCGGGLSAASRPAGGVAAAVLACGSSASGGRAGTGLRDTPAQQPQPEAHQLD